MRGASWGFRGAEANGIFLRQSGPDPQGSDPKAPCAIYHSDFGFFAVPRADAVALNGEPLREAHALASGDVIGIGPRRFDVQFFEADARLGNPRQIPDEEGLGVVYDRMKRLFRWLGMMKD